MLDEIRTVDLRPAGLDPSRILQPQTPTILPHVRERAAAGSGAYKPLTVEERFEAFDWMGYKPHGLYLPYDNDETIRRRVHEIGAITDIDQRLRQYHELQAETACLDVPGRWSGQQAWARSDALYRLVAASRRAGKTSYCAHEAVAMVHMRPRSRVWLCASTMGTVDRCFQMVKQLIKDLGVPIHTMRDARDEKYIVVEGGAMIEGVSLDERSHNAGAGVDLAIIDEANEISRDAWLHVVLPPLADRAGRAFLISSYSGQENFFYEQVEDAAGAENWELFTDVAWEVNFYSFPQQRATPTIKAAEREAVRDPAAFLEEFANIPVGTRRAIYPQYRDEVHLGDYPYRPGTPVMLGIDPSSGANEYGLVAVQEYDRNWFVIDEFYRAAVMAEDVMAWADDREWRKDVSTGVCDSAMPTEIRRWRDNGWNVLAVEKPMVEERIVTYRRLLRDPFRFYPLFKHLAYEVLEERGDVRDYEELSPYELALLNMEIEGKLAPGHMSPSTVSTLKGCARIFINKALCPNTAHEHKTYAYRKPPRSQNAVPEKPRKWKDHLVDCFAAGTPVETMLGPTPIEDIQVGDLVLTRQGYRCVTAAWLANPSAEVMRVRLSSGESMIATKDHRVWVQGRGWTQIRYLMVSDKLESSWQTATRIAQHVASGENCTGQSRRGTTSTISTAMRRITTRLTSPAYLPMLTSVGTSELDSRTLTIGNVKSRSWKLSDLWRQHGTVLPKAWIGTENKPTHFGRRRSLWNLPASGAADPTDQRTRGVIGSVLETVQRNPVKRRGWTTKLGRALDAALPSWSINMLAKTIARPPALRVIAIEPLTERLPVYDLTVEGEHEFFANGALVHNCLGYLAWMFKRYDVWEQDRLLSYSYLRVVGQPDIDEIVEEGPVDEKEELLQEAADEIGAERVPASPLTGWLAMQRAYNRPTPVSSNQSTLVITRR